MFQPVHFDFQWRFFLLETRWHLLQCREQVERFVTIPTLFFKIHSPHHLRCLNLIPRYWMNPLNGWWVKWLNFPREYLGLFKLQWSSPWLQKRSWVATCWRTSTYTCWASTTSSSTRRPWNSSSTGLQRLQERDNQTWQFAAIRSTRKKI